MSRAGLTLTADEDADLRAYAKGLSRDDGEDAYHDAVVKLMDAFPGELIEEPVSTIKAMLKVEELHRAQAKQPDEDH